MPTYDVTEQPPRDDGRKLWRAEVAPGRFVQVEAETEAEAIIAVETYVTLNGTGDDL